MSVRRFFYAAVLAVVGVLAAPPTGQAAFLLQLTSGAQTATIDLDSLANGPGSGSNYSYANFFKLSADGTTTGTFSNLTFAGYTISAATNVNNLPGDPLGGTLSLNGLTIRRNSGAANDLTIALTATGYTQPVTVGTLDSTFTARLSPIATTTPTLDYRSSFAFGNHPFGDDFSNTATTTGSGFGKNHPFGAFDQTTVNSSTGSYSLTNVITITGLGTGSGNRLDDGGASSNVTPLSVPAPAGLILVAGAVPFLALLRRRSTRSAEPTTEAPVAA